MKTFALFLSLLLAAGHAGFAQASTSPAGGQSADAARFVARPPLSDSTQQLVHKLFKRARLFGVISAVSGGVLLSSGVMYDRRGESFRDTGFSLVGGGAGLTIGILNLGQFSRRRERAVLAALERGQPLPAYAVRWLPLIGR
ncbi:hypothetical protein [Hymenobacter sp.]|uniref:hypothetical protein n=1 Tax=Hymenobacter sp. TaxID=1898978 RepID=UPI00286A353D|nr:hypothetical protein [Hymenobacter sp.]